MWIKGATVTGVELGAFSLADLPGAYFWLNPGERVTTPVGTRVSNVEDAIRGLNFSQATSAAMPLLAYKGGLPWLRNLDSQSLASPAISDFNALHTGEDWTMYLALNLSVPAGVLGGFFANTTPGGGNTGFALYMDNRQSNAARYNALWFWLGFGGGDMSAVCPADSFAQNTDMVLRIRYRHNVAGQHELRVSRLTRGVDGQPVNTILTTVNSTAATAVPGTNANHPVSLFRPPSGSRVQGYAAEIFIMLNTGKINDQRQENEGKADFYFVQKYL